MHAVHKYDLPDAVYGLITSAHRLLASTRSGIAVVEGNETTRYFVDRATDSCLQLAQATR
jgi:hypothetical protein